MLHLELLQNSQRKLTDITKCSLQLLKCILVCYINQFAHLGASTQSPYMQYSLYTLSVSHTARRASMQFRSRPCTLAENSLSSHPIYSQPISYIILTTIEFLFGRHGCTVVSTDDSRRQALGSNSSLGGHTVWSLHKFPPGALVSSHTLKICG